MKFICDFNAVCLRIFSILFLLLSSYPVAAQNIDSGAEYSNPFSDYVPFDDEYDVDEDERFMYFGRSFGVGVFTGTQTFGGNIGKLYNTALPTFAFRLLYFFDFRVAGQIGINSSNHAFSAQPNGFVEVNIFRIDADLKYYFNTKNLSAGLTSSNPFIVGSVSSVYRTQVFQDTAVDGAITKDNSIALSAGFGFEFALQPKKVSLNLEVRMHQIFFKDRFSQEYNVSGIPDLTGPLYSFHTGVLFFF